MVIFDVAKIELDPSLQPLWVLLCCHSGRQVEIECFGDPATALAAMQSAQSAAESAGL